jgi:hypothetical protein
LIALRGDYEHYLGGYIFGEHSLIERDLEEIRGLTLRRTSEAEQPYSDSSNFADCTRY